MASGNGSLMDRLMALPKWLLILLLVLFIGLAGFGMLWYLMKSTGRLDERPAAEPSAYSSVQEASYDNPDRGRYATYRDSDYRGSQKTRNDDYWESLASLESERSDGNLSSEIPSKDQYLDPSIYSEYDQYRIRKGFATKAEIDAEHASLGQSLSAPSEEYRQGASGRAGRSYSSSYIGQSYCSKPLTKAQQDSAYIAKLEMAYQVAEKHQKNQPTARQEEPEAVREEPERTLPAVTTRTQSAVSGFSDDGIISSLDDSSDQGVVHYAGQINSKPVKATFLKSGKLSDGERVIIRLMQDLQLTNGLVIPANTHITGICSFSKRLKINVSMLHYNGRMFPVDLSVYDNDGTEGIYCPLAGESEKKSKSAKEVIGDALSAAGSVASTIASGNIFMGRMVSSGVNQITRSVQDNGTVSVNVSAGYEFYVFENYKEQN